MSRTFFAYHLTHFFGPFSLNSYHTNSSNAREGDLVYVVSGDQADDGGKDYSLEGLFRVHRRVEGSFELRNLKGELDRYQYKLVLAPIRMPDEPISLARAPWYDRREVHRYFSSGQNFNPLPTDPDYKARFDALLSGFGQASANDLAEDLAEIARTAPNATQRQALIQARIGQGRFRADVTQLWGKGEICALTGISLPELLIASHIKPWRESNDEERLDPANGLLLAVHADKLFDRYLLSFAVQGGAMRSVIAPIAQPVAAKINLVPGMPLSIEHMPLGTGRRFEAYMSEHHARFLARKSAMAPSV